MSKTKKPAFQFSTGVIAYPMFFVLLMWVVFWFEVRFGFDFTPYGILPRTISGIIGILFSPFIHSGFSHIANNSIPVLVLSSGLFYFYRPVAWRVLALILVLGGIGTWAIGREAYHIGASGMVYGLASFLFFKGIWSGYYRLTAFSLVVVFLYGSLVWGTMPIDPGMSWEGHLMGFISGALLAFIIRSKIEKPKKYDWEKEDYDEENDPFLKQFDSNGNFIDPPVQKEFEETNEDD